MKRFFQNIGERMRQWMQGRYGQDELSNFLCVAALVVVLLSWIPALRFLYVFALALLIWSLFRCYSRNISKRQQERAAYMRMRGKVTGFFSLQKRRWTDRKDYRYLRCRQCGALLRVPRGKGTVRVTCPKCHSQTVTKT